MRRLSLFFAGTLLVALGVPAHSDTLSSPAELRKFADGVMGSIGAGNFDGAVKQIRMYTGLPAAEFDVFTAQVANQLPALLQRYGPATGYDFVREDVAGQSLIRLVYLEKHEKSALRWAFIFYKGEKGWVLSDFKLDSNLLAVFPGGG
jgi:hypothetical protein